MLPFLAWPCTCESLGSMVDATTLGVKGITGPAPWCSLFATRWRASITSTHRARPSHMTSAQPPEPALPLRVLLAQNDAHRRACAPVSICASGDTLSRVSLLAGWSQETR